MFIDLDDVSSAGAAAEPAPEPMDGFGDDRVSVGPRFDREVLLDPLLKEAIKRVLPFSERIDFSGH